MATLEEQLQLVEFDLKYYKTESFKAYDDMAVELVKVKALSKDSVKRLIGMERTLDEHTTILHEHTALLNKQNERLDRLEAIASEHTARFDHLETRFDHLETTLAQILARLPEKP